MYWKYYIPNNSRQLVSHREIRRRRCVYTLHTYTREHRIPRVGYCFKSHRTGFFYLAHNDVYLVQMFDTNDIIL